MGRLTTETWIALEATGCCWYVLWHSQNVWLRPALNIDHEKYFITTYENMHSIIWPRIYIYNTITVFLNIIAKNNQFTTASATFFNIFMIIKLLIETKERKNTSKKTCKIFNVAVFEATSFGNLRFK